MNNTSGYTLAYLDEAKQDVREAKAWYKEQKNGLQKAFAKDVTYAIKRIRKNPLAFAIRYRNIQSCTHSCIPIRDILLCKFRNKQRCNSCHYSRQARYAQYPGKPMTKPLWTISTFRFSLSPGAHKWRTFVAVCT